MSPEALSQLHAACFTFPRPWSEAEFSGLLTQDGVFLETDADRGFLIGRVVLDEVELLTLAVAPDTRRQGIARALVDLFETRARTLGARRAFLEVAHTNTPACGLYESCGFRHIATRPGYYSSPDGRNIDALIMEKALETS